MTNLVDDKTANIKYNPYGAGIHVNDKKFYSINDTGKSQNIKKLQNY